MVGVAIRQIATPEHLVEKKRIKVWKKVIIQEVAQELQAIWKGYKKVLESQRDDFQIELKRVNGRLDQIEAQSTMLTNAIVVLKAQKAAVNQGSTQNMT